MKYYICGGPFLAYVDAAFPENDSDFFAPILFALSINICIAYILQPSDEKNFFIKRSLGIEIEVQGMPNAQGMGYCDYVLYGKDGKPIVPSSSSTLQQLPSSARTVMGVFYASVCRASPAR